MNSNPFHGRRQGRRLAILPLCGVLAALAGASPASAQIVNEATASGSYGGNTVVSNVGSASVPLAAPQQVLSVSVVSAGFDAAAAGDGDLEAGDTLTFVIGVRNDGNVTLAGVMPEPAAIDFGGNAHSAEGLAAPATGPATLAPGAGQEFTFVYTLAAADIYSAAGTGDGVRSNWTARGTGPAGEAEAAPAASSLTIEADPELVIAKSFTITTDGGTPGSADVGDVITYSYLVTNTGNVALSNVYVSDAHEAGEEHAVVFDSSTYDGTPGSEPGQWNVTETVPAAFGANGDAAADGVYETLGVGGAVTFTYAHEVTQAEFDAQ